MAGLYVHIPFCASRCIYCGFYSTLRLDQRNRYIGALEMEMKLRKAYADDIFSSSPLKTIYLGGGTPSQLDSDCLQDLFQTIDRLYGTTFLEEVTMECNPDDLTPDYCKAISATPVNRISMGVQTFNNERLAFLHRRHRGDDIRRAIDNLRNSGIGNISIDLMFGFPAQDLTSWEDDISRALSLDVEHISAYSLTYEEGTRLYEMLRKCEVDETGEDDSRTMYEMLVEKLEDAGYNHYEISNFSKDCFQAIHNSNYWNGTPYMGIGAAAHSYNESTRSWNVSNLKEYIDAINRGIVPQEVETLSNVTRFNDMVTTALRTSKGLDLSRLDDRFRLHVEKNARKHLDYGTLEIVGEHVRLTKKGLFVSDDIMSDLIYI